MFAWCPFVPRPPDRPLLGPMSCRNARSICGPRVAGLGRKFHAHGPRQIQADSFTGTCRVTSGRQGTPPPGRRWPAGLTSTTAQDPRVTGRLVVTCRSRWRIGVGAQIARIRPQTADLRRVFVRGRDEKDETRRTSAARTLLPGADIVSARSMLTLERERQTWLPGY